jgi:hypothetical protein
MSSITPTAGDLDSLLILIECMEITPRLAQKEVEELRKKQLKIIDRMIETGENWNKASSGPSFLSLDEKSFQAHMRMIDNDLGEQTSIVSKAFAGYLEIGEMPAPYYAWRIAVILRRAKMLEIERRFLAAWCRHFMEGNGSRYAALNERNRKLNSN